MFWRPGDEGESAIVLEYHCDVRAVRGIAVNHRAADDDVAALGHFLKARDLRNNVNCRSPRGAHKHSE